MSVCGRNDDGDAAFSDFHVPQAMHDRDVPDVEFFFGLDSDLLNFQQSHFFIRIIFQKTDVFAVCVVAHDTFEDHDGAVFRPLYSFRNGLNIDGIPYKKKHANLH